MVHSARELEKEELKVGVLRHENFGVKSCRMKTNLTEESRGVEQLVHGHYGLVASRAYQKVMLHSHMQ